MLVEQSDMYVNHMHPLSGKNDLMSNNFMQLAIDLLYKYYNVEWFSVLNVHKFCLKLTNWVHRM